MQKYLTEFANIVMNNHYSIRMAVFGRIIITINYLIPNILSTFLSVIYHSVQRNAATKFSAK